MSAPAMTPQDVLNAAADLLERDGWTQGRYRDGRALCALGAIGRACDAVRAERGPYMDQVYLLEAAAKAELNRRIRGGNSTHLGISYWNDRPERTLGEVLDTLRDKRLVPVR